MADGDKEKEAALAIKKKKAQAREECCGCLQGARCPEEGEPEKRRNKKKRGPTAANAGPEEEGEDHLTRMRRETCSSTRSQGFSSLRIPA